MLHLTFSNVTGRLASVAHLSPVVHPGAQLQVASLVVERKVHHIHRTGGAELGRRRPEHIPSVLHCGQASEIPLGVVVCTKMGTVAMVVSWDQGSGACLVELDNLS